MKKRSTDNLPYNLEEEKIVLGMMIIDDILRSEALGSLTEDDFYEGYGQNRIIFNALRRVYDKGLSLEDDPAFLSEELNLMNEYENSGGNEYIAELMNLVSTTINFEEHIRILKNNTTLRNLLKLMRNTDAKYLNSGADDIQTFVDEFSNEVTIINEKRRISNFIASGELIERYKQELPLRTGLNNNLAYGAITTGYADLDRITHGLKRGEYIIIAGRPSMGKTALALNIALQSARRSGKAIGFFSLEMPAQLLIQRMLSIEGRISSSRLTTGQLTDEDYASLEAAYENVSKLKIYIDDSSDNSAIDIVTKATKLKNSNPDLGMIIIDYLSFIKGDPKLKTEQEKVSDISRRLKSLAKTLEIPVVVLSQLSRSTDNRPSKKPILSDLRSSGSIEQDADIVMLLYREAYYLSEKQESSSSSFTRSTFKKPAVDSVAEEKQGLEQELMKKGLSLTEILIAKNRNGSPGKVELLFNLGYGSFDLVSKDYQDTIKRLYGSGGDFE